MSRRGGVYARVGLATVIGGAAVAAIIARASAHDTVPGRQKVLARIRKASSVAGLGKSVGNTSTSNAGLGELLGPPPFGVDWATSEPKVPDGLALPPRMVIGTGAGRSAVPLTGELADWLTKTTGAHMSSIIDKAIRASPPLHKNSQADRSKDVAALNALVGQVSDFDKLATFLERAGYTTPLGACDLSLKASEPTRLSFKSSISGTSISINAIDWVNRATHAAVQKLITSLTKGGTDENSKRLAVMEKIGQNSFVNGFPRLSSALKAHGFLNQGVPMTPDSNETPLQLGYVVPLTTEARIVNGAAAAPSAADFIGKLVDAAIASQPSDINPERAAAYRDLKSVSDTYNAAGFVGVAPTNLNVLLSYLDLVKWTQKQPDYSKLTQVPEAPLTISLFVQFNVPDQRDWVKNLTAESLTGFTTKITDRTTPVFRRFQLTQLLLDPKLNAQFVKPPTAGPIFDDVQWKPSVFAAWAIQSGWLHEIPPQLDTINPAPTLQERAFFYRPIDTDDAAQVGTVGFNLRYVWDEPKASDAPRPGQSFWSLFEGPTAAGSAGVNSPVGLSGVPKPASLAGGTGFAPVQPKALEAAGVNYTSKKVLAAWTSAKATLLAKTNSVKTSS